MDMAKMMQQAKQMQDKMQAMQAELANVEVTGQSGGGMVVVTMTCKGEMKNVKIAPEVMDPTDPDMVGDLVVAACNDAKSKADSTLAERTKEMMSSMGLPANIDLPM